MAILQQCPICHKRQTNKNKVCKCGTDLDKSKRSKKIRYWIAYRTPDGKQRFESVSKFKDLDGSSIKDAKVALSKRQVQKEENRLLEVLPDSNTTFNELIKWFLNLDKVRSKACYKTLKSNLKPFAAEFGNIYAGNLKPAALESFQVKLQNAGLKPAYINAIIDAGKSVAYKAFDNDLIAGEPLRTFRKVKKLDFDNARVRTVSHAEFVAIQENLQNDLYWFIGYFTGMRLGEIEKLTWKHVDLSKRLIYLTAGMTKEGRSKKVPIARTLRSFLMQLPDRGTEGSVTGRSSRKFRNDLISACKKASIPYGRNIENGITFHDLRRTWITNARKAGIPRNVSMKITGHSSRGDMAFRYDQIDDSDLLNAVDKIEAYFANVDQSVDQRQGFGPNHL